MPFGNGLGDAYSRKSFPFIYKGIDTTVPANFLEPEFYPLVKNMRQYSDGRLSTRPGVTALSSGHIDLMTIARLNDPVVNDYTYIVKDGVQMKYGKTTLTTFDTGYNNLPLTYILHRPERSPSPLLYYTEGSKMRKVNVNGAPSVWGILPPTDIISVDLSTPPSQFSISDFTSSNPQVVAENGNVWNKSLNASTLTQVNRTNTTISAIKYDSGATGWVNIIPASMGTDIQPGQRILANSAEYILVEQVFPAVQTTSIESIVYISGSTGECVIQLTTPTTGLITNNLVLLNSTEYARILSVTNGPDGKPCFRCSTTGTFSAGQSVQGVKNFRSYSTTALSVGNALVTKAYESIITPAGIGNIRHNIPLDLSSVNGRPITDDDEICVGVYLDDISALIEARIWIDVDPGTTLAYQATDLSRNYYFYPFRPDDLQKFAVSTDPTTQLSATFSNIQSAQLDQFNTNLATRTARDPQTGQVVSLDQLLRFRQQLAQGGGGIVSGLRRKLLQKYDEELGLTGQGGGLLTNPIRDSGEYQASSGKQQWYQLRVKVGDLIRIGTDQSLSLKNSTSFMVNFTVSAATTVRISSAWIGGTYGPDTQTSTDILGNAYFYRTQPRNSATGEIGLPSPPTRSGVVPRRQEVRLSIPYYNETGTPVNQVDKLDIYRYGGSLLQWTYIGTVDNVIGGTTFTDNFPDNFIVNNPVLRFDNFAPFPTADVPKFGTCNVTGTRVTLTSGVLNTNYAPGTEIIINGKTFLFYAQPDSPSTVELTEAVGTVVGGNYEIPNPIIMGTPLPVVFGPYGQGTSGLTYFGLGDANNPGILYWTNGNDANSASDLNFIEVTSPSDPLIGGCIYDGRPFIWSSKKMFYINENLGGGVSTSQFTALEVANSKGAWNRLGICVDTMMYFIGKDGIYESEGGQPRSITDDTLYALFPHEGQPGTTPTIPGIAVPDFSKSEYMSLIPDGQFIRFIYQDQFSAWHMLIWEKANRRWWYDQYGNGGVRCAYADEGQTQYRILYGTQLGSFAYFGGLQLDIDQDIESEVFTFCFDGGDSRSRKRWGDVMLDISTGNVPAQVDVVYDNFVNTELSTSINSLARGIQILDIDSGEESFGINLGLHIIHPGTGGAVLSLYEWQPSYIVKPENTFLRATDWASPRQGMDCFLQGIKVEADTQGVSRTLTIEAADTGDSVSITINHPQQQWKVYPFPTPLIGSSFRILPTDLTVSYRLFNVDWITEPIPESASTWITQETTHDVCGWQHIREGWITLINDSVVIFKVTIDGVDYTYNILPAPGAPLTPQKVYIPFQAVKGKLFKYSLTSATPFRLYYKDSCIIMGKWGRADSYQSVKPFGGNSRESGAIV